jgi:photosystem II stability/assembly factor-like uncharacterized protein
MSDRLYVSTRKGLFTLTRGAGTKQPWRIEKTDFLGDAISLFLRDPRDGTLYAALTLGHFGAKLRRSDDDGATWQEIAVPAYPEDAKVYGNPYFPATSSRAQDHPAVLSEIWALETGGADEPGALWAGTIPGGLFRSDDRGDTWRLMRDLWDRPDRQKWFGGGKDEAGIHSVCVDPRDSRHVKVAISCGGVWTSRDRGETWKATSEGLRNAYMPPELAGDPNSQDPHRVVQCPANPEALWMQHHNGIFRTFDGAVHWEECVDVQPSVFGFAVVVHPNDGRTAWFVPGVKDENRTAPGGKFVVTRTRDGGTTFETLSKGLPQHDAYDLVYRHALDIDATGNRLAMGSTTGGLWTSEDGGESWTMLDARLPPVYAVRFG